MMKMKIKCGKRRLDIPRLQQIAAVFGMDAADLMTVDTGAVLLAQNNRLKDVIERRQTKRGVPDE